MRVSSAIEQIEELLRGTPNLEGVLEVLMEDVFAERGCLWREDQEVVYCGNDELRTKFPFSRTAVDSVLTHGRGFVAFTPDGNHDVCRSKSVENFHVRSVLCAPVVDGNGKPVAIFYFDNRTSAGSFTEDDLDYLREVVAQVPAGALRNCA